MKTVDLTGQVFGKLLVLGPALHGSRPVHWLCACVCGKERTVRAGNLKSGNTRGCHTCHRAHNALSPGHSARNSLFSRYQIGASKRGIAWALTKEEFSALTQANCTYCNEEPTQVVRNGKDVCVYNGIDRSDSSLGYSADNCVPCCKLCNFAKNTLSVTDFLSHVRKIAVFSGVSP